MRIALFPLRTVLFPQGLLPLRIFETRYVDMIRRVMRDGEGFGVVLIRAGAEVGAVDEIAPVGTLASVADFGQTPEGLLKIVARGEHRFRIVGHDRQPDGLNMAEVEWLEDPAEPPLREDEYPDLREALSRALSELIVDGVDTTIPLFHALLAEDDIQAGAYNIHWLETWLRESFAG